MGAVYFKRKHRTVSRVAVSPFVPNYFRFEKSNISNFTGKLKVLYPKFQKLANSNTRSACFIHGKEETMALET